MMIRLTLRYGDPVFINYNNVTMITPAGEGSTIFFVNGKFEVFKESYVEVVDKFISADTKQSLLPELYDEFGTRRPDKGNN